ncbi:MAG: asparaginase [Gammaproteobacteria bacterium]|nr:asparaginase [Gammaproteobacteria bacterium]NNC96839.1 asparaginase [Gammaproteobacteria bacterium]NNM14084.1 asparaginase [Gammaproteobacteria bacterium]
MSKDICIITTGGTIDKVYFDANSKFEVGTPVISQILDEALVTLDYRVLTLFQKDSLEITDQDRAEVHTAVRSCSEKRILITHGTDTMTQTGLALGDIPGKTIVLTGSLSPARFRSTDAVFNIGMALGAVQSKPAGVYICMNGKVFDIDKVDKDLEKMQFVDK